MATFPYASWLRTKVSVRLLPSCRLLDGDIGAGGPEGSFNVFKQRKFKLQSLQRICQRYPVVPQCEQYERISYTRRKNPSSFTVQTNNISRWSTHVWCTKWGGYNLFELGNPDRAQMANIILRAFWRCSVCVCTFECVSLCEVLFCVP